MDTTGVLDEGILSHVLTLSNLVIIHASRHDIFELPLGAALKGRIQTIKSYDPSIKVLLLIRDGPKS